MIYHSPEPSHAMQRRCKPKESHLLKDFILKIYHEEPMKWIIGELSHKWEVTLRMAKVGNSSGFRVGELAIPLG